MTLKSVRAFIERNKFEVGIYAFALIVHLVLIGIYLVHGAGSYNWGADGGDYINEAQNILHGHGFSRSWEPPYLPDAIRTPLYPLFLAGVYAMFGTFTAVLFIEALLSSLIPVLFVRMSALFVKNKRVLLAGALFLSVEPHLVFNTTFFASEGIAIVLLVWGLYELLKIAAGVRPQKAALRAGFALGLSALARPIAFYLPLLLLPLFAFQGYLSRNMRGTLKMFGIFCMVFLVTLSPWLIRNYTLFGSASMGTVGWFNVYTRLAATVVAIDSGDDFYTRTTTFSMSCQSAGLLHMHHPFLSMRFKILASLLY
jgi:4-amino-4-deoxy-L-arabinose transferase-like glycosyltransferase